MAGSHRASEVPDVRFVQQDLDESVPFADYEYVEVTFGSANADLDIVTTLRPADPDDVQYQVVRADKATSLYHDTSATRRPWQRGYIVLRSSAATATCRILLSIKRV